ncbi:MAG: TlpA disulfide reductase family protein [Deferrisomatales bacterium]|nr:TlpA disulfide reductase family protein [Deferrisomatales bacterium]
MGKPGLARPVRLLPAHLAVLACFAVLAVLPAGARAEPLPAPSWELNDLEGKPRALEDWRGRWVLLKLGTTVCPNCAQELQELAGIDDGLRELGVEVVAIYLGEDRRTVRRYWAKRKAPYRPAILYDPRGGLVRSYGVSVIPRLFLVDPEGRIVWDAGYTPGPELLGVVEGHLAGVPR